MTPAELLERAEAAGLKIEREGTETLVVRGPNNLYHRYVPQLKRAKSSILAIFAERERRAAAARVDNVRVARDIRERRWTRVPAPCAFYCGPPAATCWRCGGGWLEHPPQSAFAPIGNQAAPQECEVQ